MLRDGNHFITPKITFVFAWTIGDTNNISFQSSCHVHFVYSNMFSGIATQSKFKIIIKHGTT
jgi:hypothetical protein